MPTSTTGSSSENGPRGPIPSIFPQVGIMPRHNGESIPSKYTMYEMHFVQFNRTKKGLRTSDVCMKKCYEKEESENIIKDFFKNHDRTKYAVEVYSVTQPGVGGTLYAMNGYGFHDEKRYVYRTECIESPVRPHAFTLFEGTNVPNRPIYDGVID